MSKALLCPHCWVWSIFRNLGSGASFGTNIFSILSCQNCERHAYCVAEKDKPDSLTILYPLIRDKAPGEYPDQVRDKSGEALRSFTTGNFEACVVMTRSASQAATRYLQAKGKNLKGEIDNLACRHIILQSLAQWGHEIRDGGNLVAHPEPDKKIGGEDAEELLLLAKSIFEYLDVVPRHIEPRRQRLAQQEQPAG